MPGCGSSSHVRLAIHLSPMHLNPIQCEAIQCQAIRGLAIRCRTIQCQDIQGLGIRGLALQCQVIRCLAIQPLPRCPHRRVQDKSWSPCATLLSIQRPSRFALVKLSSGRMTILLHTRRQVVPVQVGFVRRCLAGIPARSIQANRIRIRSRRLEPFHTTAGFTV